MLKRVVVVLGLMLWSSACSSSRTSSSTSVITSVTPTTSAVPVSDRLQAANVLALIDGALGNDPWVLSVVTVSEANLLRRPVVRIAVSDQNVVNEAMTALQSALMSTNVWGVLEISGPDSTSFGTVGLDRFEPVDLPAPVASGEDLSKWLDEAFGSSSPEPEDWVDHVTSTGFAASLPTGYTDVVTVQTDLPWDAEGRRIANEIAQAIAAGSLSFAVNFTIYYSDSGYEYSGAIEPPYTFGFGVENFKQAAEEFIEGGEIAGQLEETFANTVCTTPAAIIPGEEFTCTAVDTRGVIWDFDVVVQSESMVVVVHAFPQSGLDPTYFVFVAQKLIEGSELAAQAGTTFTGATCAPPASSSVGAGFTCTAVAANGATWEFRVVVQSFEGTLTGLGVTIVSGAPRG